MGLAVRILASGFFISLLVTLGAGFLAMDPSRLEKPEKEKRAEQKIQIAEPAAKSEPPPTPPQEDSVRPASLMNELAPQASSNVMQDLGGGIGFGSGGSGPAIGGGGGFGGDSDQLVRQQAAVDRPPRPLAKTAPEYPPEARSKNISGVVVLKILVGMNGVVEQVQVQESEPRGFFDQAAIKTVRGWRFEPAVVKGKVMASWTTQKIRFELN